MAYNRILAVIGRYSLATLTPTTIGLHRLVQIGDPGPPRPGR